jgi:hypothetical protein
MAAPSSLHLLLAAGPEHAGAKALLSQAQEQAAAGHRLRVLLSGEGLRWGRVAGDLAGLEGLLGAGAPAQRPDLAVCSRQARDAGWSAATTPEGIRWSSVATWLAEVPAAGALLWVALP